ncbi:MAG: isoleucine--tRNA ligase [Roseiflexaceae bacterium]
MAFRDVDTRVSFPKLEEQVLEWWKANQVVKQALEYGDKARPFIFFEGPPTANGRPGIHHVEARVTKDIIIRYQRMLGHYVIGARGGWDTHGLPVEIEVEKALGFNGKPDIEKYGIAEFNKACKESVLRYIADWERMTDRIGFWIDMKRSYSTFDNSYIESLWWILRQFWDRNLLFRDYKVTMHCPRCGTTLSDAEVALGFEDDVDDPSVWLRFQHVASGHSHDAELAESAFIAWTTTPWTLPANVALAVNPEATYVLAETHGEMSERVVLAEALADKVLGEGGYHVIKTFKGDSLWGVRYQRLFDGVAGAGDTPDLTQAYRVVADDYVSLEDGTGIVHIAPAYGDLEIGRKYGLPTLFSVDLNGNTMPQFNDLGFGGMFFKKADPLVTRNLKERGLLFRSGRVRHAYPFCWRCKTPLLYYAKPSWYIRTTAMKDRLVANNQQIDWVPDHIRAGRFGNWLANNIDWAISRERYWGTPLPIWVSEDGRHMECIGSVAELEQKVGRSLSDLDLHRPYVDELTWPAPDGGLMRRIPDVADCWFDSGSMPVAQWHYPFENKELFEQVAGQADFITEAIDQTRGWFYTLHAVSTLLFDRPAYQHVICLGHILDGNGEKMSKSRGNIVNPWDVINAYGADAARWYMYAAGQPYNPRRFSLELVGEMLRQFTLTLWNTYSFFTTYANLDGWTPAALPADRSQLALSVTDRWALARLNVLVRDATAMLNGYDVHGPAKAIEQFVEELSNWYVRRNRRRFWKAESDADKQAAYATLYTCLTTLARLLAPFMPFVAEELYRNLVAEQDGSAPASVHLAAWPLVEEALIDEQLLSDTALLLETLSLGRAARRGAGMKVRQPLSVILVRAPRSGEGLKRFEAELRDELNIKEVRYLDSSADFVEYRFKPNLRLVGKKYGKLVPALTAALKDLSGADARAVARALEEGRTIQLSVADQMLDLQPDELLVESSSPEGYAVAEGNGVLVALDTTITPELEAEGLARELVRNIQDARKSAGFAIADRITLYLEGSLSASLQAAIENWGEYVRNETLADTLVLAEAPAEAHREALDLQDQPLTLALVRR